MIYYLNVDFLVDACSNAKNHKDSAAIAASSLFDLGYQESNRANERLAVIQIIHS